MSMTAITTTSSRRPARPLVLTTGDIAAICKVKMTTVISWIDDGLLKSWRVPCGTHRRVERADLADFLRRRRRAIADRPTRTRTRTRRDNDLTMSHLADPTPTRCRPGSLAKQIVMRSRIARGERAIHDDDVSFDLRIDRWTKAICEGAGHLRPTGSHRRSRRREAVPTAHDAYSRLWPDSADVLTAVDDGGDDYGADV